MDKVKQNETHALIYEKIQLGGVRYSIDLVELKTGMCKTLYAETKKEALSLFSLPVNDFEVLCLHRKITAFKVYKENVNFEEA
jgi:hypothetical protein